MADSSVIHWLIHTDIEQLLARFGVVQGKQYGTDQIVHVNKVSFDGIPLHIQHNRNGLGAYILIRLLRLHQLRQPDHLELALVTAIALQQNRKLAAYPESRWSAEKLGPHLERLLAQLGKRCHELTEKQQREFDALR